MNRETSADSNAPGWLADLSRQMREKLTFIRIAEWIRHAWRHLVPIRVPIVIVIAAAILVRGVPQINELFSLSVAAVDQLRSGTSSRSTWLHPEVLRVLFFAALLGLSIWHSARTLLSFDIVRSDSSPLGWPDLRFKRLAPRALALSIIALIALGFGAADGRSSGACAIAAVLAGLLVWSAASLVRMVQGTSRSDGNASGDRRRRADWRAHAPWKFWAFAWTVFVVLNLFAACFPAPLAFAADSIGPLSTLLFLASLFIVVTTPLALLGACARLPIFVLILVAACSIQLLVAPRSHAISTADSPATPPSTLENALRQWAASETCDTAYFVSTEGGGVRAAAWTALALARLERHLGDERFGQCLVAASGVSGGSLGLAAFVAGRRMLLETPNLARGGTSCDPDAPRPEQLECRLGHMMTRDFLSPLLAAMFTVDQAQLLLPFALSHDRGTALEQAFSRAFEDAFPTPPGRLSPFDPRFPLSGLYAAANSGASSPAWTPMLVLNTTDVHSGMRVLQAGVDLDGTNTVAGSTRLHFSDSFPAAVDISAKRGTATENSLVGAVHNSARFSYASPAGLQDSSASESIRQFVDGGYFENSGTTTLLDLVRAYRIVSADDTPRRLVVIHISNDANMASGQPVGAFESSGTTAFGRTGKPASKTIRGEIAPPPMTLLETRHARGEYARSALFRYINDIPKDTAAEVSRPLHRTIALSMRAGGYPLPLGWRVGDCALAEMQEQLESVDRLAGTLVASQDSAPLPPVIRNLCRPAITTIISH